MYDKNEIDQQAEREAKALSKQGRIEHQKYIRQQISDYNKDRFAKLFKKNGIIFAISKK